MKKLTLSNAAQAFKKGIDKRNSNHTEKEIASFIDDQIDIKKDEIKGINKTVSKYSEQNKRDFIEGLVIFDEQAIKSVKSREEYAQRYVVAGVQSMNSNKKFLADRAAEVEALEAEIKDLQEFRTILEGISEEIEVESAE